jgi:hypothetical protein
MKKLVSVTLTMLLLATCFTLWAQEARTAFTNASRRSGAAPAAPTALVKHVLKGTYNSSSIGTLVAYGAGFNRVDGVNSVVCPGTSGTCFILADQWIQLSGGANTPTRVALCFLIDGSDVDGCSFLGDTLENGNYSIFSVSQGQTVPFGTHTVQTVVYVPDNFGANSTNYNFNYRVYKP